MIQIKDEPETKATHRTTGAKLAKVSATLLKASERPETKAFETKPKAFLLRLSAELEAQIEAERIKLGLRTWAETVRGLIEKGLRG